MSRVHSRHGARTNRASGPAGPLFKERNKMVLRFQRSTPLLHFKSIVYLDNLFYTWFDFFNPLNTELNPICYLLALLAHHFLHVSRIRVKSLTLRLLMSYIYIYIYMERLFLMFLDHTQRRSTVGRTPLDE